MNSKTLIHLLLTFGLAQSFFGCVTSMTQLLSDINYGMDKSTVVEKLGSPNKVNRHRGKDQWVYRFYQEGTEYQRSIFFLKGRVIKVGKIYETAYLHRLKSANTYQEYKELVKGTPSTSRQ